MNVAGWGGRSKSYNKNYEPRSTNGRVLSLTEFQARMLAAIAAAWGSRGGGEGLVSLVGSLQMFFVVCFSKDGI